MTISNQSFEAVLYAWTYAADDALVASLVKPTCDYLKICHTLKLYQMLGQVIITLSKRAIILCEYERYQLRAEDAAGIGMDSLVIDAVDGEIMKNLEDILSSDWQSFYPSTLSARILTPTFVWNGVSKIRGEILLKILLYFIRISQRILPHDVWTSFIDILLYARHNGILPISLSTINNNYLHLVSDSNATIALPQSIHAIKFMEAFDSSSKLIQSSKSSYQPANKAPISISSSSEKRDSLRQSSSSIWKLLWSETSDDNNDESSTKQSIPMLQASNQLADQLQNIHDLVSLLSKYPNMSSSKSFTFQEFNGNIIEPSLKSASKGFDPTFSLLRRVLESSDVEEILFHSADNDEESCMMVISIFDALMKPLSDIISQITSLSNSIHSARLQADAIVLIEWTTVIVTSNQAIVNSLWNKLHRSIFSIIFDSQHFKSRSSFFVERCLVSLFRAASKLLNDRAAEVDEIILIWSSINLVRNMSRADISSYAGVIGAGLLTILR